MRTRFTIRHVTERIQGAAVMRVSMFRADLTVTLSAILFAASAWAQTDVGSISGAVTDSSGASVPDCSVTSKNLQTGLKQTVRTQVTGFYTFAILPTGTYSITAEKRGFRNSEVSGVVLD